MAELLSKVALSLIILFWPSEAVAQQSVRKSKFEVETNWPGVRFKFVRIERISGDRLLIVIRIVAGPSAPPDGTLIALNPSMATHPTLAEAEAPGHRPRPFSIASSVMIDDLTSQRFPALAPISPHDRRYAPAEILTYLTPGRAEVLTLQFKAPPPHGGAPGKQTVSLLLTNAKGPISGIPIPPPGAQESVQR